MSEVKLPEGWRLTSLGKVVDYGKTNKCELIVVSANTWVLELEDIERDSSKILQKLTALERPFKSTKNRFQRGDVLYGKLRPYLNKVVIADDDGVCTTEIIPLNSEPLVDNRFLFFWLKSERFLSYVNEVSYGVNMPRLGTKDGIAAPFVLAPFAEQKIIADKLDTLLAQVESSKARLERIPHILKRFRQSVLADAVSGKLTEEWRYTNAALSAESLLKSFHKAREEKLTEEVELGNKETKRLIKKLENHKPKLPNGDIPESWRWTSFMDSMERVVDCHNKTAPYIDEGIPLIRTTDIRNGKISLERAKSISQETYEFWSRRCPPEPGDIIFTREAPMGEAGIIAPEVQLCMGQRMMLLRPMPEFINPKFVLLNILSLGFQKRMNELAIGTGVKHLRVADVESLTYPLAPIEEQTEIVTRVEQLFAYADTIEQRVQNALARVNNLSQAILAKAFRGELTEQWRKDNPNLISGDNSAEALLAKIQAEREAMQPKKKTRARKMTA